ncbi:hypothetical protein TSOC_008879, partial [Tetrabaena socialis]
MEPASSFAFVFAFDPSLVDAGLSLAPCRESSACSGPANMNVSAIVDGLGADRFHRRVTGALTGKDRRGKSPAGASFSAEQLCATLRQHGLHALLVLPGHSDAGACGGGRNASDGYFCSRQPYVLVYKTTPRPAAHAPCSGAAGMPGAEGGGGGVGGVGGASGVGGCEAAGDALLVEPHLRELFR